MADVEPYTVYGHFYDATQRQPDTSQYRNLLRKFHPKAKTLLEIACGTGAHLAPLAEHYEVTGLDLSRTMLRYARKRLPGVRFHHQNMAGFRLGTKFDAVICPYDSINHMVRFEDWVATFKAVKEHLNPKGVFVFDMNTEYRLRDLARLPPWAQKFGEHYVMMKVSTAENGIADWDVTVFERGKRGTYRLHHEVIQEKSFPHEKVKGALREHFGWVKTYDPAGWSRVKASSRRLFYVCGNPLLS